MKRSNLKRLRFGNSVICEHVIAHPDRTITLVNVYPGEITVPQFPARLVAGIYVELIHNFEALTEVHLTVSLDKRRILAGSLQVNAAKTKDETSTLSIPLFFLVAREPGILRTTVKVDGFQISVPISKKIIAATQ